jgi:hypothetical protein
MKHAELHDGLHGINKLLRNYCGRDQIPNLGPKERVPTEIQVFKNELFLLHRTLKSKGKNADNS